MTSKIHVKTDDSVIVIAGKDRGKTGKVVKADPTGGRVFVAGVNMVKKHQKARGQNKPAGIIEREGSIDASNVMIVCPKCGKPTRVSRMIAEDGKKTRVCKKCGAQIDKTKKAPAKAATTKAATKAAAPKATAAKVETPKETAVKPAVKKATPAKAAAPKAAAAKAATPAKKATVKKETVKEETEKKVTKAKAATTKAIKETEKGE